MIRRLALLAASWLIADGALYLALQALDSSRIFYDRSSVSPARLKFWLANSYDPELGWDVGAGSKNNLGAARRADYPQAAVYQIKAFGDSFTFGSDVGDGQTWEAAIEREMRWACLNYGVPGYGPDQALLKYRRTPVRTEYTILGIQEENIARVVNIYRAFYMEDWGPPKPRFFLDGDGLRLKPNPIARPEDAGRLLDPVFVDSLRKLDYWPHYNEDVLGAPRRLEWPATWIILSHAPFFLRRGALEIRLRVHPTYEDEARRFKPYHLYNESSEAFRILARLIDRFAALCAERGERPLVLVFPMEHTVGLLKTYGRCVYAPLQRHLDASGVPHIDFGPLFAREDFARYYVRYNGHFSAEGNERVAREIIHYLHAHPPGR
ncbi:MAG TPA: hypothetical protein VEU62_15880 [Bryobacterales bacterium]|nr:hypothetical protein [Bryobacterales bacterium]